MSLHYDPPAVHMHGQDKLRIEVVPPPSMEFGYIRVMYKEANRGEQKLLTIFADQTWNLESIANVLADAARQIQVSAMAKDAGE